MLVPWRVVFRGGKMFIKISQSSKFGLDADLVTSDLFVFHHL